MASIRHRIPNMLNARLCVTTLLPDVQDGMVGDLDLEKFTTVAQIGHWTDAAMIACHVAGIKAETLSQAFGSSFAQMLVLREQAIIQQIDIEAAKTVIASHQAKARNGKRHLRTLMKTFYEIDDKAKKVESISRRAHHRGLPDDAIG